MTGGNTKAAGVEGVESGGGTGVFISFFMSLSGGVSISDVPIPMMPSKPTNIYGP